MKFFGDCDMKKYLITFEWVETSFGKIEINAESEDKAIEAAETHLRMGSENRISLPPDDYPFFDFKSIKEI